MAARTIVSLYYNNTGAPTSPRDFGHLAIDANGDLYGTTFYGGNAAYPGDGSVFEVTDTGGTYASTATLLYSFSAGSDGASPQYAVLRDSAGDLFGTTSSTLVAEGDAYVQTPDTIFELVYAGGSYTQTTLYTFPDKSEFSAPTPIMDSAGNLFGVYGAGGADNEGTIFELAKTNGSYASTVTTLYSFTGGADGGLPDGPLIMDKAGDLFGTTGTGGANGDGTVFEVKKTNGAYAATPTTIASLSGSDYNFLIGGLLMDSAGDLFGTTAFGGADNDGAVFEIKFQNGSYASTPTILYSFTNGTDGQHPTAGLLMDAAGDLFGTANDGPGASDQSEATGSVFALKPIDGGYVEFTIADFGTGVVEGMSASSGLTRDAAGDLFGTAVSSNNDAVYEIPQNGASIASVPKTLATFGGAATQQTIGEGGPYGGLVMDRAGDLFGTTTDGSGSVFEIAYTGAGQYAAATTIATFAEKAAEPLGNLIMDASGDLFGTTATGGANGEGSVFEIKFANGSYASTPTTLYSFTGAADGDLPAGGLVMDANGNLFGTTSGGATGVDGGPSNSTLTGGTVFELKDTNGTYASTATTLYTFTGGSDGSDPLAGLIMDAAGDLFGTTTGILNGGAATVFEIKHNNGSYASPPTVLASFTAYGFADAILGGLVMDTAGDLFGVTGNSGTVFELKNNNGSYSSPITLATGVPSDAGLVIDAKGDLFGSDIYGGANNLGWIFEIKDDNGSYDSTPIDVGDFAGNTQGAYATSTLILDQAGDLFGTTQGWKQAHDSGTVFELGNVQFVVACFRRGTLIEIAHGHQQKVEDLEIGDEVRTASGALRPIKWIGRRSYSGRFIIGRKEILPVCFKAGSLGDNVPTRDLWISPQHAMYFAPAGHGGVLIEAKDLINGISIVQAERVESVEYFHIELDTHDVIVAEGALSETFIDDDSRAIFHNAQEYDMLYATEASAPARYCAPRLKEGYTVEAVRQQLALRAGLPGASDATGLGLPHVGALRGYIDFVGETCIAGWAQNSNAPEAPVCLDILADGRLIGQTLANRYRADLERTGLGTGRHGFRFDPPAGVNIRPETLEVRRSLDGAALPITESANRNRISSAA
jgi:uncharacterized repeat protein (TIGR03803 family)